MVVLGQTDVMSACALKCRVSDHTVFYRITVKDNVYRQSHGSGNFVMAQEAREAEEAERETLGRLG